jgi:hypothetical protein
MENEMNEPEFDERIQAIKKSLNILADFQPLMVSELHKKELMNVAAHLVQIEVGIKKYSRPKDWALLQEGVSS